MILTKIIADSGGTKTDWIGIAATGEIITLQTKSYHPIHVNPTFIAEEKLFWSTYDLRSCQLQFFGAGCLAQEKQVILIEALEAIGFNKPSVQSDLYAAAYAVEVENGWVAICGTGSVVVRMHENRISELKGGLGWEVGDEGSGYYFGKLLLERLKTEGDDYPEIKQRIEQWKSLAILWSLEKNNDSKFIYAHLVPILSEFVDHPLVKDVHFENVNLFFKKYCNGIDTLSFVGGYANFQRKLLLQMCVKYGVVLNKVVARPIEILAEKSGFLN